MGCACSGRSYIENSINDMWNTTILIKLKSLNLISIFEKATAYKKDLRNHESFCEKILNPLLTNKKNPNPEIDFLKNTHFDVSKEDSFEIPFVLLFLTKSEDYIELHDHFNSLFTIIDGRMNNPKKLRKNISSLRLILEFYVAIVSLFSIQSYSLHTGDSKTEIINEFSRIYSVDYIKRHIARIFIFDKNMNVVPNNQNEAVDFDVIEKQEKLEILEFFKNNFERFNPSFIREFLYDLERKGLNSEKEIKRYEEEENNLLLTTRKTKTIKRLVSKKN